MNNDLFSYSGIVYHIHDIEKKDKGFEIQKVVLLKTTKYNGKKYRNYITFSAIGKKVKELSDVKKGHYLDLFFTLNGNRWDKEGGDPVFFNQLRIQRVINRGRAFILDPGTSEAEDITEGEDTPNKEFQDPLQKKKPKSNQKQTSIDTYDLENEEDQDIGVPF
jgi:hypothetical protein